MAARRSFASCSSLESSFFFLEGAFFSASFLSSSNPPERVRTNLSTSSYSLELSPPRPEMMSGVRASSMRMESTSSMMQKLSSRCTIAAMELFKLSRR